MDFMEEERRKWIEWELNSKDFLKRKILVRKDYPTSAGHTHCEFCWGKFGNGVKDRKVGYFEKEKKCWICDECFEVFKDYFQWEVEDIN